MNPAQIERKNEQLQRALKEGAQIILGDREDTTISVRDYLVSRGHSFVTDPSQIDPHKPVLFLSLPFGDVSALRNTPSSINKYMGQERRAVVAKLLKQSLHAALIFVGDISFKLPKECASKCKGDIFWLGRSIIFDRVLADVTYLPDRISISLRAYNQGHKAPVHRSLELKHWGSGGVITIVGRTTLDIPYSKQFMQDLKNSLSPLFQGPRSAITTAAGAEKKQDDSPSHDSGFAKPDEGSTLERGASMGSDEFCDIVEGWHDRLHRVDTADGELEPLDAFKIPNAILQAPCGIGGDSPQASSSIADRHLPRSNSANAGSGSLWEILQGWCDEMSREEGQGAAQSSSNAHEMRSSKRRR